MITVADLRAYCGAPSSDDAFLEQVLGEAQALISAHAGNNDVPQAVWDNCLRQVGSELYHRRNAPAGIAAFATLDGAPIRVALDPMRSTYAMLDKYVPRGL